VAQPATAPDHIDPTLVARAQRYEREAIAELCDRNLDVLYRMCDALMGDAEAAESLADTALLKALDGLPTFDGDGAAFDVWLLRLAASIAARRRPHTAGLRLAMARLSNFDYELIALRLLAGIDIDHLEPALNAQPTSLRASLVSALRELDGRSGTGWGPDLRAFDAAVDRVRHGEDPMKAASKVSAPSDTAALLRTVAELGALNGDPVPPETATRLRTNVLAAVAERRALWVYRNHGVATVPGIEGRRYPSPHGTIVALATAGALALLVGAVVAMLSSFAGPDSTLYPLKRLGESILVAIDLDPTDRASLEIKLAQTRAREAEDMAGRGDGEHTVGALNDHFVLLRAAARDLSAASVRDRRWTATRDRLLAEDNHPLTNVRRDLDASGQTSASDVVDQLITTYESDRKQLDAQLRTPAPRPSPPATP
jgi:DNA-directed RNA polymerase specialized sigma24 family protein